jgi:hypothetical protein
MRRSQWVVAVASLVLLVGAVLFAGLAYTLPLGPANVDEANDLRYTRCDAAIAQALDSPGTGPADVSTESSRLRITSQNLAPCKNVARYRLGIAVLFVVGSVTTGLYVAHQVRKNTSPLDEPDEPHVATP